jgi:hypothetical protein
MVFGFPAKKCPVCRERVWLMPLTAHLLLAHGIRPPQ